MTHDDFGPDLTADEQAELDAVAARLTRERPLPAPAFRGDLRRRIVVDAGRAPLRRRWGFALSGVGAVLLAVAAIGLADAGPLAPDGPPSGAQAAGVR